jgi:hypothetical protein
LDIVDDIATFSPLTVTSSPITLEGRILSPVATDAVTTPARPAANAYIILSFIGANEIECC